MDRIAVYDMLQNKYPKGAITKKTKVNFSLKVNSDIVKMAMLMIKSDSAENYKEVLPSVIVHKYSDMGDELNKKYSNVSEYTFTWNFSKSGHYWYCFKLITENGILHLSKTYDNFSYVSSEKGEDFLQLVTEEDYFESMLEGGIIYQILVDRFCKQGEVKVRKPLVYRKDWGGALCKNTTNPVAINQEVFGGNLEGVISKLDYLKELGVTVIYFNPICEAHSNHKYDTADYMKVDEMYGDDETLKKLTSLAKAKGIKIVIDGVYNHTGSDSVYFNKEKRYGEGGAYNDKNSPYYNWYEWKNYPNEYNCWWGINTLPNVRDNCKEFREFIAGDGGVIDKYMKLGVSGFRLDVVDEISDEFLKKIYNQIKKNNPIGAVIGEVWEDAATKISYSKRRTYFANNELTSVMNYPLKEGILNYLKTCDTKDFVGAIRMIENNYPLKVQHNLMNFLGTHDTSRIFTEILNIAKGDYKKAKQLSKIATCLLFTSIGTPSIYYGDEYGMQNNDGSSRGCFVSENGDIEILENYKKLAKIREKSVFKNGDMNILYSGNGKLVYERINKNERVIVLTNLRDSDLELELDGKFKSLLSGKVYENGAKFNLKQLDFEILQEIYVHNEKTNSKKCDNKNEVGSMSASSKKITYKDVLKSKLKLRK